MTALQPARAERILVIRLGALGDLVMCAQAFHEIRKAHPAARIAILTTPAFAGFAELMPWFDKVILDDRPAIANLFGWLRLRRRIKRFNPTHVYDLQGKRRQSILYGFLGGPFGPIWSGAAPGCRFPRVWPPEAGMHFIDFLAAQLRIAGVKPQPPVDWSWLAAPLDGLHVPERFILFTPGCTPKLARKRWPPAFYAQLANRLIEQGYSIVLTGTKQDADTIAAIRRDAPQTIDLMNRTTLPQLAELARRSVAVVGNDTGPMHLAAAVGAPTLALFSGHTDPVWSRPPGQRIAWLKRDPLENLPVDEVLLALQPLLAHNAATTSTGN